jgi:hypothetical protein
VDRNDADGAVDLDREYETWYWTRAAGVSADELRAALWTIAGAKDRRINPDRRQAARSSASTRRAAR